MICKISVRKDTAQILLFGNVIGAANRTNCETEVAGANCNFRVVLAKREALTPARALVAECARPVEAVAADERPRLVEMAASRRQIKFVAVFACDFDDVVAVACHPLPGTFFFEFFKLSLSGHAPAFAPFLGGYIVRYLQFCQFVGVFGVADVCLRTVFGQFCSVATFNILVGVPAVI